LGGVFTVELEDQPTAVQAVFSRLAMAVGRVDDSGQAGKGVHHDVNFVVCPAVQISEKYRGHELYVIVAAMQRSPLSNRDNQIRVGFSSGAGARLYDLEQLIEGV
jgi:hypothetical protein